MQEQTIKRGRGRPPKQNKAESAPAIDHQEEKRLAIQKLEEEMKTALERERERAEMLREDYEMKLRQQAHQIFELQEQLKKINASKPKAKRVRKYETWEENWISSDDDETEEAFDPHRHSAWKSKAKCFVKSNYKLRESKRTKAVDE